jgi:hypothetical protein
MNEIARRLIEAVDSLPTCASVEALPERPRRALPLSVFVEVGLNRTPSNEPKSFSLRSDVKIGDNRDTPRFGRCWREIPSAVMRALLRSDANIESK